MAGMCKSCLSSHREVIDERLSRGESIDKLSEWLKDNGESISPPSLLRHRKNHIAAMCLENNKTGRYIGESTKTLPNDAGVDLTQPFIDTAGFLNRIIKETADTNIFTSVIEARKFTQLLMERIVQNQLVIVHELQLGYTAGTSGYPDAQIRGLKTILDITNALPTYADKRILTKMKDSHEGEFTKKIENHAVKTADDLNEKYETTWSYVLSSELVAYTPYDLLNRYSEIVHANTVSMRESWCANMRVFWSDTFNRQTNEQLDYEITVKKAIEDEFYDEEGTEYDVKYSVIVKAIMKRYTTPEQASDDSDCLVDLIRTVVATFEPLEEI